MDKMKNALSKLRARWRKEKDIDTRIDKYKEQIEKLKQKLAKIDRRKGWVDTLLPPLAQGLKEKLGKRHYEILGPFGLSCETSIWFYDTQKERDSYHFPSLAVRPDLFNEENPFGITIKSSEKVGDYPDNTIGAINGFNYPDILPPGDADIDWFLQHIKRGEEE